MFMITIITLLLAFIFTFTSGFRMQVRWRPRSSPPDLASRRQGIILVAGKNFSGAILSGSVVTMTISGLLTLDPA